MGRGSATGKVVDDATWKAFLNDTVTPRFPDGLTVLDAYGQWRNPDGVIEREPSNVLIVLVPPSDGPMRSMNEIADEYKTRFNQGAVLKTTSDACVEFR